MKAPEYTEVISLTDVGLVPSGIYRVGNDTVTSQQLAGMWHRVDSRQDPHALAALEVGHNVPLALASPHCLMVRGRGVITVLNQNPLAFGPSLEMVQEGTQIFRRNIIKGVFAPEALAFLTPGTYQLENIVLPKDLHHGQMVAPLPMAIQAHLNLWPTIQLGWTQKADLDVPELKQHESVYILGLGRQNGLGSQQMLHALRLTFIQALEG